MTSVVREVRTPLGRPVSLLRSGEPGRPIAIFLHGVPTGAAIWRPVLERLPGVRAVAPELPGFGRSVPPATPHIERYHRLVAALADAEDGERPILVGHDLGALYALTYALARPGAVHALVLLNTTIYAHPVVVAGLLPLLLPGLGEAYAWLSGRGRYARLVRRDVRALYPRTLAPALAAELVEPYGSTSAWHGIVRALRGLSPVRVLLWRRRMRTLDVPVLVLWGEGDPYFPASVPERLRRTLPNASVRIIRGGGHFPMLSRPDEVVEALTRFLA